MEELNTAKRYSHLPASEIAGELNARLATAGNVVVTAPPGAGKSTLLPITIMEGMEKAAGAQDGNDGADNGTSENAATGKVLMLEPRRIAARQIAERMASMLGEKPGATVGYRIRFESKVSAQTRIEVITEGILTRMAIDNPTLDGVSVVVFDEFHERNINSDLAFALIRQIQQIIRPDLKIVVMSATIDASAICQALGAPLIESEGRLFPVTIVNSPDDTPPQNMAAAVAAAIAAAHRDTEGDILAFLPGQADIQRCAEMLDSSLAPTAVLPLYGNLTTAQQHAAIAPSRPGERKVVLATPIAETSITIEGVRTVVDSGLCRAVRYDPHTGLSHLETVAISKDMATQRAGRAGRVAPGTCYRLWTTASAHHMKEQRTPEIEEADLAKTMLDIASFGERDITALPWLTPPPTVGVVKARQLLTVLGAIESDGSITPMGRKMSALPCHPRIARMIVTAGSQQMRSLACDIAATLEERDPMADGDGGSDLTLRISMLRAARRRQQPGRWSRIAQIAREYGKAAHTGDDNSEPSPYDVGRLVAYAYPERIAKATDSIGGFRLASGNNVRTLPSDTMGAYPWLAIASLHSTTGATGQVFLAAPADPATLGSDIVSERDNASWDAKAGCVVMQHEQRIGKLTVATRPIDDIDSEEVKRIVCEAVGKYGLSMLAWSDDKVASLQQRVLAVAAWHPELTLPDLSTAHLMATAADWLPLYLERDGRVLKSAAELKRLPLDEVLWAIIPYDQQLLIDRLAPTHIRVPTGSNIRIDYRAGSEAPVLSVRLQECFGMEQTPRVDDGRQPLLMELLSPGYKPVQLTQDLASFWHDAYFDVRKELRRRYPKHYWPENPLEAEAVRGVKRAKK